MTTLTKNKNKHNVMYYFKYLNIDKAVDRRKTIKSILEKNRGLEKKKKNIQENDKITYNL